MTEPLACAPAECTPPDDVDAAALFRAHENALRAYFRRRLPAGADADDAVQEVFVRVLVTRSRPECETCTPRWLWGIARHVVADARRRQARGARETALTALAAEPAASAPDVHEDVLGWLRPAVRMLPDGYREAVWLADIERLPQAEVAARLGLSVSGAKSRIQRGRAMLASGIDACCDIEWGADGRALGYTPRGVRRRP